METLPERLFIGAILPREAAFYQNKRQTMTSGAVTWRRWLALTHGTKNMAVEAAPRRA